MTVNSKLIKSLNLACHEVSHPWDRSCSHATGTLAVDSFKYAMKTYASVYLLSALLQGKLFQHKKWMKMFLDIVRSSCFLSWTATSSVTMPCIFRRLLQRFYWPTIVLVPGFVGIYTAILIERESRRKLLAVYMLNTMSEVFFNMLESRGYVRTIPNGEVLLFSVTMSVFFYFYKKKEKSKDITSAVLSFIIGPAEGGPPKHVKTINSDGAKKKEKISIINLQLKKIIALMRQVPGFQELASYIFYLQCAFQSGPRHKSCIHDHSCFHYSVTGFLKPFFLGYGARVLLSALSTIKLLRRRPKFILFHMVNPENINTGLFLGLFAGSFKFVNCLLRWTYKRDDPQYGILAGFIAGLAMYVYPAPSLASYVFWKLIEQLCMKGVDAGHIPHIPQTAEMVYSILTAAMFHIAIVEPQSLKKSYWKFLVGITNTRIQKVNRLALEEFGFSSKFPSFLGLENVLPDPPYSEVMQKIVDNSRSRT